MTSWRTDRRWLGIAGPIACLVLAVVWVALLGFPGNEFMQIGWVALILFSFSLHDPKEGLRAVVVDWSPILVVLFLYDVIHDQLGAITPATHTWQQIHFDRFIGGGHLPTLVLQHAYHPGHPHIWDYAALAVYTSHFYFSLAVTFLLWKRRHPRFRQFVWTFVTLTTIGYVIYIAYPANPPWLASVHGALPPVHRVVQELFQHMGLGGIAAMFSQSSILAVDTAAMPSLHASYPVLMLLFFWRSGWRARIPFALYALAMSTSLVYLGEHYVADILVGWSFTVLTWIVVREVTEHRPLSRRVRARRQRHASASDALTHC